MSKEFPQYRKLINGKSYYIVSSASQMTEYASLGSRWQRHDLTARILPERNLIADLLACHNGTYVAITEKEFQSIIPTTDPG